MGLVYSTHGRDEKCVQNVGPKKKNLNESNHSQDLGIDGKMI